MGSNRMMSPKFLARTAFFIAVLEGEAHVWGQLRIPAKLVVGTDAAATAANILANESLFRLSIALGVLAVAFNVARTVFSYLLFRPVGRTVALLIASFGVVASALQAASVLFQLPALVVLKSGKDLPGFSAEQLQSMA